MCGYGIRAHAQLRHPMHVSLALWRETQAGEAFHTELVILDSVYRFSKLTVLR